MVLWTFRSRIVLLSKFVFVLLFCWFCYVIFCACFSDIHPLGSTCWRFRCWSSLLRLKLQGKMVLNRLSFRFLRLTFPVTEFRIILDAPLKHISFKVYLLCKGYRDILSVPVGISSSWSINCVLGQKYTKNKYLREVSETRLFHQVDEV